MAFLEYQNLFSPTFLVPNFLGPQNLRSRILLNKENVDQKIFSYSKIFFDPKSSLDTVFIATKIFFDSILIEEVLGGDFLCFNQKITTKQYISMGFDTVELVFKLSDGEIGKSEFFCNLTHVPNAALYRRRSPPPILHSFQLNVMPNLCTLPELET